MNNGTYNEKIQKKDKNREYLDSLKSQMGEKNKTKIEMEHIKRLERADLEKLYDYNPFGKSGAGAPIKDQFGNTLNARKTIENTLYKDQGNPYEIAFTNKNMNAYNIQPNNLSNNLQYIQFQSNNNITKPNTPQQMLPSSFNNNNQSYNPQIINDNQSISNHRILNPQLYNYQPLNPYIPTYGSNNNSYGQNNLDYNVNYPVGNVKLQVINNKDVSTELNISQLPLKLDHIHPSSSIKYDSKVILAQENLNNSSLSQKNALPSVTKPNQQEENEKVKRMQYQNLLLLQIEENKRRKEEEKQKQWEANKIEDQKIKDYLEKLNDISKKEQEKRLRLNKVKDDEEKVHLRVNSPNKKKESPDNSMIQQKHPQIVTENQQQQPQISKDVRDFQTKIGISFENINRVVNDTLNEQIKILKNDVNKNHKELNDLIYSLHSDSKDAYQVKYEAERELGKIKEQLEKKKINDFVYEKKINEVLEKSNAYRNLYVPIQQFKGIQKYNKDEFDNNNLNQFYNNDKQQYQYKDLESSSKMIYSKDELNSEKLEFHDKISKLANVGKSLMGDTQFVPISEPRRGTSSERNMPQSNETYYSFKNKDDHRHNTPNFILNSSGNSLGTQYSNKKPSSLFGDVLTTYDLNNQIDEIAKISYKNDPKAKLELLNKKIQFDLGNIDKSNTSIEYHDPKKFSKKVDFQKLDNMLNSIIDEDTRDKVIKSNEPSKFKNEESSIIEYSHEHYDNKTILDDHEEISKTTKKKDEEKEKEKPIKDDSNKKGIEAETKEEKIKEVTKNNAIDANLKEEKIKLETKDKTLNLMNSKDDNKNITDDKIEVKSKDDLKTKTLDDVNKREIRKQDSKIKAVDNTKDDKLKAVDIKKDDSKIKEINNKQEDTKLKGDDNKNEEKKNINLKKKASDGKNQEKIKEDSKNKTLNEQKDIKEESKNKIINEQISIKEDSKNKTLYEQKMTKDESKNKTLDIKKDNTEIKKDDPNLTNKSKEITLDADNKSKKEGSTKSFSKDKIDKVIKRNGK